MSENIKVRRYTKVVDGNEIDVAIVDDKIIASETSTEILRIALAAVEEGRVAKMSKVDNMYCLEIFDFVPDENPFEGAQ